MGMPFAYVAERASFIQNRMVAHGASWDFAAVDYTLGSEMVAIYYAIFMIITLAVWGYERKKVVTLQHNDTLGY